MDEVIWYHGTRRPFKKGGLLLPRSVHGKPGCTSTLTNPPADEAEWVYITTDRSLAEQFAILAPGRGKPKVLTVSPLSEPLPDPATFDGEDRESYRVEYAKVTGVKELNLAEVLSWMTYEDAED